MAKVKYTTLVIFTNQLSAMISANLPLGRILESLSTESLNKKLLLVIRKLKDSVESGVDLGDAVSMHPKVFDSIYVNMVKAGMETGSLDETLRHLSSYMEKTAETRSKVKAALAYPIFMIFFLLFVVSAVIFYILPMFKEMYAQSGKALPLPTQILLNISNFVLNYYHIGLFFIAVFVCVVFYLLRTPWGRMTWDQYKMKIPLFGKLMKKSAISKFLRTFSTLIQSDVPILDTLTLVSTSGDNKYLEFKILHAKELITHGVSITDAFKETEFFPDTIIQMIYSGEETGELDKLLVSAANFYEDQVDEAIKTIVALVNPILTLLMGGVVGMILIAIFLPIIGGFGQTPG